MKKHDVNGNKKKIEDIIKDAENNDDNDNCSDIINITTGNYDNIKYKQSQK